jgi:catechol 2,3-dioxygenase-like lactoylglutathione lyase family enzyme
MVGKGLLGLMTAFHHFQVTVSDLEKSRAFYGGFLGLREMKRPQFAFPGAWFELANGQELHIVCVPNRLWRSPAAMEIYETHIALRVASFQGALDKLHAAGFHEDHPDDHALKMVIKRESPTGYPQVYFFDPDRHLLEWNAAILD